MLHMLWVWVLSFPQHIVQVQMRPGVSADAAISLWFPNVLQTNSNTTDCNGAYFYEISSSWRRGIKLSRKFYREMDYGLSDGADDQLSKQFTLWLQESNNTDQRNKRKTGLIKLRFQTEFQNSQRGEEAGSDLELNTAESSCSTAPSVTARACVC